MSLASAEIVKVEPAEEPPRQAEGLAPGRSGIRFGTPRPVHDRPAPAAPRTERVFDYGSDGYLDYGYG